ncbi:MAG: hypothetical protein Q9177_005452 [Variospora cf. flavescens]
MLSNRVDQPTEPENSTSAPVDPAFHPENANVREDDHRSHSRPVSESSRPQPAVMDFARAVEEGTGVNDNAEKPNTMLTSSSLAGKETSTCNPSSKRSSVIFKPLSHIATSLGSGRSDRSSISSVDRSFRQSVLFRSSVEDYEFEQHPSAKNRRRRDSKAIPKSWKFLGITAPEVGNAVTNVTNKFRRGNFREMYEKAKVKQATIRRSSRAQFVFKWTFYVLLTATIYLLLIGLPLWRGAVWYMYILFKKHLVLKAGMAITFGLSSFRTSLYAIAVGKPHELLTTRQVVANGNSPEPLDNTAEICRQYDVSHTWSPLGSKIIAQFVGCYVARKFPNVLLIDDDCLLPPNLPIVSERLKGNVQCIGYIMKSIGENGSLGTLCQQAQDLEYKLCGLAKDFAGKVGSVTFPHGCIVLWDRELLVRTFHEHPGFSVSEDWFFGHAARQLGSRITMCTSTFVETETPSAVFFSSGGARGGFGEMTIYKQRFFRWNYFFVTGMYYDLIYILFDWKLGWWEIGAKIFVFQEIYETMLYLLAPFVIPISFATRPAFAGEIYLATIAMYALNALIFNYVHLRSRKQSVSFKAFLYYNWFKWVLGFVNIASCYYAIYTYATYFAKRHPKVIEDHKAVEIILRMEEKEIYMLEKEEINDLNELMYSIAKPVMRGGKRRSVIMATTVPAAEKF